MKTPEDVLNEVAAENLNRTVHDMIPTKAVAILAMLRYAKLYHENELKKTNESNR